MIPEGSNVYRINEYVLNNDPKGVEFFLPLTLFIYCDRFSFEIYENPLFNENLIIDPRSEAEPTKNLNPLHLRGLAREFVHLIHFVNETNRGLKKTSKVEIFPPTFGLRLHRLFLFGKIPLRFTF